MSRADLRRAMRERLDLTVAESEARHRAIIAALPNGVLLQDADGTVLVANPRACDLLGISGLDNGLPSNGVIPAGDSAGDSAIPIPRRPDGTDLSILSAPLQIAETT